MPPCRSVLLKKIERTEYLSHMIKYACNKDIAEPRSGWIVGNSGEFQIEYFTGNPFPEIVTKISFEDEQDDTDDEEVACSSNDEFDDGESDDEWNPK